MTDCLSRAIIWQLPGADDTQLTISLVILIYFIYIAIRHFNNDIIVQKGNIVEGVILLLLAQFLGNLGNGYIRVLVLCVSLWVVGSRVKYRPLPTNGKAVLITGCDRGIGHDLAKQLDKLGYEVFAGCLFKGSAGERELMETCSDHLHTLQLDVTDTQQVETAVKLVQQQLGKKKLWGVVNNAGICYIGNIETIPQEDILRVLAVNFLGPVNVCKAFLPLLRQGKGRLVNIASNSGLAPVKLMGIYCASKSALAMLSETLRYELKDWGIHVSTVVPSGYRTGILTYNYTETAERWWSQASNTVQQDYGKHCFTPQFKYTNHQSTTSKDLSTIVDTVTEALSSKSPQAYYYRGFLARSLPFLYLHMPSAISDMIMSILADWFVFKPQALQKNDCNKTNTCRSKTR